MKLLLATVAILSSVALTYADTLPPEKLRAKWSELADFGKWEIAKFKGWAVPFDGGSKVFFFESAAGERFDVMAANPAYWTEEDKRKKQQVFFLVHEKKFYRIESGSKEETSLISAIEKARPNLTGEERTDPKLLDQLVKRLKSRQPMFSPKG